MSTLFESVTMAPRDPILGLNEQFNADTRPIKVNLGVGIYYDDAGRIPLLQAVHCAEVTRLGAAAPRGYLPIEGLTTYNKGVQTLLLGQNSPLIGDGRVLTIQTLGGTGALKIGADFLREWLPSSIALISNPSWENHRALFERAGFTVKQYPYYDAIKHGLDFDGLVTTLKAAAEKTVVVLHACCHNPTGVDLTLKQWQTVVDVVAARNLVPFLDIAYQGFGEGLEADAAVVRLFAKNDITTLISSSFSKSFSLYGERVGALTVINANQYESACVLSQLKRVIRTNYSNPPTHGGTLVATVLHDPELFALWDQELAGMRSRVRTMRYQLVNKIRAAGVSQNFDFVLHQRGMFSYSGLTASQIDNLREKQGIYALSTGRICVAALNSGNIDRVANGIATVLDK